MDLPPEVRIGVRAEIARQKLPVARTLVLTAHAGAFVDAISRWTIESRFPVLIDDGTDESRQRIAKFVRAFEPEEILRWSGDGTLDLNAPESIHERARKIDDIVARTWGAPDRDGLFAHWLQQGFAPPGVVVASIMDRAWPAAAALAAGRGQPILWIDKAPGGRIGSVLPLDELVQFDRLLVGKLEELGIAWRDAGDVIETVTLCLNMPSKIANIDGNADEPLSLTDRIGRHSDDRRWGWSGLIYGDECEASWRAMCALFLQPDSAWFFDGYSARDGQFQGYDVAPAANLFAERGHRVTVDNRSSSGLNAWRARARLGVSDGFIHVNSSGSSRRFTLSPGRPYASDVPMLWKPAVVHFIHSFSAHNLDDRVSIARAWLDRGAYAYIGSVQEPYLQAFQTPEAVAQRLFAPVPLGVAAIKDMNRAWRILYIGDPLITFGPAPPEAPMPELAGAESVETAMRESLRNGELAKGIAALALLGRDADAARLLRAIVDDKSQRMTPEIARVGWPSLLRTGQAETLRAAVEAMDSATREDAMLVDMLWLALRPALAVGDAAAIQLLRTSLRRVSFGDDAIDLANAIRRAEGDSAARAWLSSMQRQAPNDRTREQIRSALKR